MIAAASPWPSGPRDFTPNGTRCDQGRRSCRSVVPFARIASSGGATRGRGQSMPSASRSRPGPQHAVQPESALGRDSRLRCPVCRGGPSVADGRPRTEVRGSGRPMVDADLENTRNLHLPNRSIDSGKSVINVTGTESRQSTVGAFPSSRPDLALTHLDLAINRDAAGRRHHRLAGRPALMLAGFVRFPCSR